MSDSADERRARFRTLHEREQLLVMPNPWDVGSARLLESLGFEALATTSAGFAWSLGKLDQTVSRDELVAHVASLAGATDLPLNVVPTLIVMTFTFIGVLGSFTVPYLIGPNAPQMIGVAMQSYFNSYRQPQPAVAMAVMTFVAASIAGAIYVWATARSGRAHA